RSVGQFEQMYTSRCFTESRGQLGCTSCHDPHQTPAPSDRDRFYSKRCLTCHAAGSMDCSESPAARRAKNDLCVVCHMPKPGSSNIAHTSITDHRIPRRLAPPTPPAGLRPGTIPVIPFPIGPHVPSITEEERDLGIALARLIPHIPADEVNTRIAVA